MVSRDFSGRDIIRVLVNEGNFEHVRTNGDHFILKWTPPDQHETEPRTVVVPYHDRIDIGTLRNITDQVGARDFESFCRWIDRSDQEIPK